MYLTVKRPNKSEWQLTIVTEDDEFTYTFTTFHGMFLFISSLVQSNDLV